MACRGAAKPCGEWGRDVLMVALPPKLSHAQKQFHQLSRLGVGIESFRFEEHNEYEYEYEI